MGVLLNLETGQRCRVFGRSLVGRSPRSDIRLCGAKASMDHATINWDGACWTLKDLSRNGTRINDMLLNNGQRWRIALGDTIVFGDPSERWSWFDDTPPCAAASCREQDLRIEGPEGVILLPDETAPRASLCLRGDHWELDVGGTTRTVQDGDVVRVADLSYELELPCIDPETSATRTYQHELSIRASRVHFQVSQDEEYVSIGFNVGAKTTYLRPRAFHYTLLMLARARLQDIASGAHEAEAGWVYADDLSRRRRVTVEDINVDICRARKQISQSCKFVDSVQIVERRNGIGQLRFGVASITMETSATPAGSDER
jgi:hypothetical protein